MANSNPVNTMQEATGTSGKSVSIDLTLNDNGQLSGVSLNGEAVLQAPTDKRGEVSSLTGNDPLDRLLNALLDTWQTFVEHLPVLGISFSAMAIFGFLAVALRRLTRSVSRKTSLRHGIGELIGNLLFLSFWLIGFLVAIKIYNPEISASRIMAIIGVASLALSFIFRDVVENFFAGLLMLWQFPFENGDYIELQTNNGMVKGEVIDVQLRMTLIREISNELLVVPNAELYSAPLRVNTWKPLRRDILKVQVPYEQSIAEARDVLVMATDNCEKVESSPKACAFANEFAESGIEFMVCWWTGSAPLAILQARDEVVEAIKQAFDQAHIEIPYPHRKLLGSIDTAYSTVDSDDTPQKEAG